MKPIAILVAVIALVLSGCTGKDVPIVTTVTKADPEIPRACFPESYRAMPKFTKISGGTDFDTFSSELVERNATDATNRVTRRRCFCDQVESHGSKAVRGRYSKLCRL